jgi:GntR family phosphonate transport system transcriptional regulator
MDTAKERVVHHLKRQIAEGRIPVGERLPSENALGRALGVGRGTVRRALAGLQLEGFVRTEKGRGSFVQTAVLPYELSRTSRFCHSLDGLNVAQSRRTISTRLVSATAELAHALRAEGNERLAEITVLNFADGLPVLIAVNAVSATRFPGIADCYERKQSFSEALRTYGASTQNRTQTDIVSRLPTREEARLLMQSRTAPVLEVTNLIAGDDEAPFWQEQLCFAANRVKLQLTRK